MYKKMIFNIGFNITSVMKQTIKFSTLEEFEKFKEKGYSGYFKGKLFNNLTYFCGCCNYKSSKFSNIIKHEETHGLKIAKKRRTPKRSFSKKPKIKKTETKTLSDNCLSVLPTSNISHVNKSDIDLYCYEDINDIFPKKSESLEEIKDTVSKIPYKSNKQLLDKTVYNTVDISKFFTRKKLNKKIMFYCNHCNYRNKKIYHTKMHIIRVHILNGKAVVAKRTCKE